jgi:hypothetical protein
VGTINCVCGKCDMCKAGLKEHCRSRTVLGIAGRDGCFAERFTLPAANLFEAPDHVDDDRAVFTEPLAAALQILRQLTIEGRPNITVLGDGRLGLLCAQVLSKLNATVRCIGRHPRKLELCEKWGVKHRLLDDVGLRGDQDIVVDCTGSPTGLEAAMKMVRPRGTIVLKTTIAPGTPGTPGIPAAPASRPVPRPGSHANTGCSCGFASALRCTGAGASSRGAGALGGAVTAAACATARPLTSKHTMFPLRSLQNSRPSASATCGQAIAFSTLRRSASGVYLSGERFADSTSVRSPSFAHTIKRSSAVNMIEPASPNRPPSHTWLPVAKSRHHRPRSAKYTRPSWITGEQTPEA